MELTSEKSNEPKVEPSGRRSFCICLIWSEWRTVGALLAIPLVRFVTYPLRKKRDGHRLVRSGTSAGFCLSHRAHRKDHYVGTSRCLADHLVPDGGIRVAVQRTDSSAYCRPSVRIWAARSAGWTLRTSSSARAIQDRLRPTESALQDHRLAPWIHSNPKWRTAC